VVFTFWGIYAVDRALIFPKRMDAIIPPWLNHAFVSIAIATIIWSHEVVIYLSLFSK